MDFNIDLISQKLIWWKTPAEVSQDELLIKAMEKGSIDCICELWKNLGQDAFLNALRQAKFGDFTEQSWSFWHHRLGFDQVPAMPKHPAFEE
jgi:hypothetical protein